jgi:hypothetical protein
MHPIFHPPATDSAWTLGFVVFVPRISSFRIQPRPFSVAPAVATLAVSLN